MFSYPDFEGSNEVELAEKTESAKAQEKTTHHIKYMGEQVLGGIIPIRSHLMAMICRNWTLKPLFDPEGVATHVIPD